MEGNQEKNVFDLLDIVNDACIRYDPYEHGVPLHSKEVMEEFTKDILSDFAVLTQEEWGDVKHMFWVLLRTVEGATDPAKHMFSKMDVEAGYRLGQRLMDYPSTLVPDWKKEKDQ